MGACSAVTTEDLHRALGISFHRGEESGRGRQSTCDYAAGNAQVSVTLERLEAEIDVPAEIAALKRELPGASARAVAGLGSTAFVLEIPGAGAQLHVIRGQRDYLMVSILGLGDAQTVGLAAEKLARAGLERL
jgi:hypothetical protein